LTKKKTERREDEEKTKKKKKKGFRFSFLKKEFSNNEFFAIFFSKARSASTSRNTFT
jgi:hypothetical protein